jgi:hypothetical protein
MPKAKIEPDNHDNGMELDPIINALLEHLPPPGDYFSQDDRQRWLKIMELSFDMIYEDQPNDADRDVGEQQHS